MKNKHHFLSVLAVRPILVDIKLFGEKIVCKDYNRPSGAPWLWYLAVAPLLHFKHFSLMCHQGYVARLFLCKLNRSCFWPVQRNMLRNTHLQRQTGRAPHLCKRIPGVPFVPDPLTLSPAWMRKKLVMGGLKRDV